MFGGEAEGGGGAAGGAVEDGDEEGGSLHHGAVAAEHAAGSIDRLKHLDCAAGGKERVVARLLLCRPAVFLRGARDHGRKDRLRRSPGGAAGKDGLGKILVAAAGHAAQEGPEAAVIDLLQYSGQELTRYVYQVTNYPDSSGTYYATLLVKDGQIVGADIASSAKNGVMHGLKMPE